MKRAGGLLPLVLLIGCASLPDQGAPEANLDGLSATTERSATSTVLGHTLSWTVTEHDLVDTPDWLGPEDRNPPLPVSAAVVAAKAEIASYLPDVPEWQLQGVRLERLGWQGKWFYVVEWKARRHHSGDFLEIPVLMSGRPVRLVLGQA